MYTSFALAQVNGRRKHLPPRKQPNNRTAFYGTTAVLTLILRLLRNVGIFTATSTMRKEENTKTLPLTVTVSPPSLCGDCPQGMHSAMFVFVIVTVLIVWFLVQSGVMG